MAASDRKLAGVDPMNLPPAMQGSGGHVQLTRKSVNSHSLLRRSPFADKPRGRGPLRPSLATKMPTISLVNCRALFGWMESFLIQTRGHLGHGPTLLTQFLDACT